MPRPPSGKKKNKHAPLLHQIDPQIPLQFKRGKTTREDEGEDDNDGADLKSGSISGKMSKKVLQAIKEQRMEIEHAELDGDDSVGNQDSADRSRARLSTITPKALLRGDHNYDGDDDNGDDDDDNDDVDGDGAGNAKLRNPATLDFEADDHDDNDTTLFDDDEFQLDLNAEDRAMLEAFLPSSLQTKRDLTATILTNADQRETTISLGLEQSKGEGEVELKPAVPKEVMVTYQKIGLFLSKYRSGKLPKAFKIIPTLRNWEEIMYYTNPAGWSPQATNAAAKLFSSVLKPKHAQRFYSLVIAPKVSAQIAEDGKLGYHLYDSLRRAIYKPTAFFKGLILPIAAGYPAPPFPGQKSAPLSKEVIIYASILHRIHIPQVHAAVTLLQMSKIVPFNPYNVLLMKVLIDKKYSLPIAVIEGLLAYFYETANDDNAIVPILNPRTGKTTDSLPLLWHKTLLHFVQRYKQSFSDEMIAMARAILKKRPHHGVSDEIRRELAVAGTNSQQPQQQVINTDMFDM